MAVGGFGFALAQVNGDRAQVAVATQGFEEGVSHHQVAVAVRVDAVAAPDVVLPAVLGLGLGHHVDHRIEHIREHDALFFGHLFRNVAQGGQRLVVHLRPLRVVPAERVGIDATW